MEFMGEILGKSGSSVIDQRQWIGLIRDHSNLVPPQPREAINPFTKQPTIIRPRPDIADVVIGGKHVGTMSWAEDDSNLINVFGSEEVTPVAQDIANLLGGRFKSTTDT